MAAHDYRDAYFEDPELLETALPGVLRPPRRRGARRSSPSTPAPDGVVALLGAGTLFGLGDAVKVSALLNAVNDAIAGRLLVFFPGEHEGNSYRLLDARDGWNYLAIPITAERERSMTITNRELFYRDPTETKIPNDGVAKVVRPETDQQWDVLAGSCRASSATASTRGAWSGSSTASSPTSARRSSRRCG